MPFNENNQFNTLDNNNQPKIGNFLFSIKTWLINHKKWILIGLATVALITLFVIYYVYWAKGYVIFSASPQNINLTIEGKEYKMNSSSLISLKPGVYSISATKDGYMTYNNFLVIKPLRFYRKSIKLSDIFYVGAVAQGEHASITLNSSFLNYWQADQSLVYYSTDANAFYKIKLADAQKTYQAPNTVGEKTVVINLDSSQQVSSVAYSTDGSKALVIINSPTANNLELVDFSSGSVQNLPDNIIYADWLGENQILAITNSNPSQLITLDTSLNEIKTNGELSSLSLPFAFNNQKVLLASLDNDQDKSILDLNTNTKTKINLEGSISSFISNNKDQAIVSLIVSDQSKTYLLDMTGKSQEFNLGSGNFAWYSDHQILYTQPESDTSYLDFKLYDLNTNQYSVIKTYFSAGASIDMIKLSPNNVFFMSANQIMGFKK